MKRFTPLHLSPVAVTLLAGLLLLSSSAISGELLPFPSGSSERLQAMQSVQETAPGKPAYLEIYKGKIEHFTCSQLAELRKGLAAKFQQDLSPKDFKYYSSLVDVVDQVRINNGCQ